MALSRPVHGFESRRERHKSRTYAWHFCRTASARQFPTRSAGAWIVRLNVFLPAQGDQRTQHRCRRGANQVPHFGAATSGANFRATGTGYESTIVETQKRAAGPRGYRSTQSQHDFPQAPDTGEHCERRISSLHPHHCAAGPVVARVAHGGSAGT